MQKRIIGIDVARALAIFGMVIVNFKIVIGNEGSDWLTALSSVFDGKAAATFVVLAGLGLALMSRSAIAQGDAAKLKRVKGRIFKRALFLIVVGISYIGIWPADILHFYGFYMFITLLLLTKSNRVVLIATALIILSYPILMAIWDYEQGWNFATLEYHDFWTPGGFLRNLFYNGFHPVIPWSAFMLVGYWFGRQDLRDSYFLKTVLKWSLISFVAIQLLSVGSIALLAGGDAVTTAELETILGTSPMPPLPFYMLNGISIALVVISGCILLAQRYEHSQILDALYKTGQLALTFYVAHVIIGMGVIQMIKPEKLGDYPLSFSLTYALVFCLLCIGFAILWRNSFKSGPLEWVMRKITD